MFVSQKNKIKIDGKKIGRGDGYVYGIDCGDDFMRVSSNLISLVHQVPRYIKYVWLFVHQKIIYIKFIGNPLER